MNSLAYRQPQQPGIISEHANVNTRARTRQNMAARHSSIWFVVTLASLIISIIAHIAYSILQYHLNISQKNNAATDDGATAGMA